MDVPRIPFTSVITNSSNTSGARWNAEKQLWFVKFEKIIGTTLEKHIQVDDRF